MCILESEQQKYNVIGTAKNEIRIRDQITLCPEIYYACIDICKTIVWRSTLIIL